MAKQKQKPPVRYSPEIAAEVCQAIAVSSKSIRRICRDNPHFPNQDTIFEWRRYIPEFREMYMNAKADQIEVIVDEILDISDDSSNDDVERTGSDGSVQEGCNTEWLARSRLRVDSRKWLAAKLAPKIYGDKLAPVTVNVNSDDMLQKIRDNLNSYEEK